MNRKYIHEDADLYCLGAAKRIFAGSNAYDPAMGGGNDYPGLRGDDAFGLSEKLNNQRADKPSGKCPPKPPTNVLPLRLPRRSQFGSSPLEQSQPNPSRRRQPLVPQVA